MRELAPAKGMDSGSELLRMAAVSVWSARQPIQATKTKTSLGWGIQGSGLAAPISGCWLRVHRGGEEGEFAGGNA